MDAFLQGVADIDMSTTQQAGQNRPQNGFQKHRCSNHPTKNRLSPKAEAVCMK
jgi:hypothetical protein